MFWDLYMLIYRSRCKKNLTLLHAKNKGADQLAHLHSLISFSRDETHISHSCSKCKMMENRLRADFCVSIA